MLTTPGIKSEGYELLCFSLNQIEYLQYYIHEMRLADPEWTQYLAKLSSANAEDQPKEGQEFSPPPYVEEENQWVPMPSAIIRASEFVEVVSVFVRFTMSGPPSVRPSILSILSYTLLLHD